MILIKKKPTTPSQRHFISLNNSKLQKKPLLKNKIKGLKNSSGTNNYGKIVTRHKGGGNKTRYRSIQFDRSNYSIGIVVTKEYDPYRSNFITKLFRCLYSYNPILEAIVPDQCSLLKVLIAA